VKLFESIEAWLRKFNQRVESLLIYFIYALVGIVTFEVVMRYFFGVPVLWARDVTLWLYSALFLLPVAYYYSTNRHISASDLVYSMRLTNKQKAFIDLVSYGFLALTALALLRPSINRVLFAIRFNEVSILTLWRPPLWPLLILIPVMLIMVLVQSAFGLVNAAKIIGTDRSGS